MTTAKPPKIIFRGNSTKVNLPTYLRRLTQSSSTRLNPASLTQSEIVAAGNFISSPMYFLCIH